MTINKRKKFSRQRGTHTHGWGSKKKHRGAGSRGGRGMAGSGKRGDAMKPRYWKDKKYFGKHGFKTKGARKEAKAVNLDLICEHPEIFLKEGNLIDLGKLGYGKLLGRGRIDSKLKIKVESASKNAVEKVKKAGGEVILSSIKKEEAKPPK
ncbi:uL15 family ribosomal protein [Candidatus Woesearchaeota archaeon]|nr:uL15 family ribosomal protein [Candidatus Woesearchaeota archaeon]